MLAASSGLDDPRAPPLGRSGARYMLIKSYKGIETKRDTRELHVYTTYNNNNIYNISIYKSCLAASGSFPTREWHLRLKHIAGSPRQLGSTRCHAMSSESSSSSSSSSASSSDTTMDEQEDGRAFTRHCSDEDIPQKLKTYLDAGNVFLKASSASPGSQ